LRTPLAGVSPELAGWQHARRQSARHAARNSGGAKAAQYARFIRIERSAERLVENQQIERSSIILICPHVSVRRLARDAGHDEQASMRPS